MLEQYTTVKIYGCIVHVLSITIDNAIKIEYEYCFDAIL